MQVTLAGTWRRRPLRRKGKAEFMDRQQLLFGNMCFGHSVGVLCIFCLFVFLQMGIDILGYRV